MNVPYLDLSKIHSDIQEELDEAYKRVVKSQWFIAGEENKRFEKEFASYCNAKACVGTGNGLDSLRLILMAYGIGQGDEVILPAHTFIATALAVTYVGATPVFVDVDLKTYNIDFEKIEEKITAKTKAIIVVHLYGRAAEIYKIRELSKKYKLKIIEDAAQSHGAKIEEEIVGHMGDAAAFSFYPGKNLGGLGDAGAVVTNDLDLAQKIRAYGNYGSYEKYNHIYQGCNSRLDELQAAFLSIKLKKLNEWNRERIRIANTYMKEINNPRLQLPSKVRDGENVFHIFPVLLENRQEFISFLESKGIYTNIHYPIPIMEQKAYMGNIDGEYSVTEYICRSEVSLPLYPGMTNEQIQWVIEMVNKFDK